MLHLRSHERLDGLAAALADVLSEPMSDPMSAEWIVVGSAGIGRWLRLQLARRLGASPGHGSTDGIAANLDLIYPGRLTRQVLAPRVASEDDPWHVDRLTWAVLDVLTELTSDAGSSDSRLGPAARRAPGATLWSRARRIADSFDRYILHRPGMVRAWIDGSDVDGSGSPLAERAAWQPSLLRAVRERIGVQSPAETMPGLLRSLADGDVPDGVPERVCLFGLTTIPGGEPFLEVVDALSTQREVQLFLHQPSAALAAAVHDADARRRAGSGRRVDAAAERRGPERGDRTVEDAARHPLLQSWARPAMETVLLLGSRFDGHTVDEVTTPEGERCSVLEQVQRDVRSNEQPAGGLRPTPGDTSLRIHSCHGATRQVEVLRDQILHLLADDPALSEDDVVVLCPALEEFAPLIEAAWGPSARADHEQPSGITTPSLSYRITDRSLTAMAPMLSALASLVELLDSRFSDAAVLDFAGLPPVRERFGFSDDDLARLADWVEAANTRWGLDGAHRQRWGLPPDFDDASWSTALDRLLLGIMITDDPMTLGPAELVPIGVEGSDVGLAGKLGDLLSSLRSLETDAARVQPIGEWIDLLDRAATRLFAPERDAEWQVTQLTNTLEEISHRAVVGDTSCGVDISLVELRSLLGRHLEGPGGRSDFFRGGVTITSLTPLRGVPFPVVCLLGMDESAFGAVSTDGDDLVALKPALGDRDRRADVRQALLDAVLSAGSHLVLTRSGHSVVTNQPTPPAVAVAELTDAIAATLHPDVRQSALAGIEVTHPRQSYDERNFTIGAVDPNSTVPWGFDPLGRDGALHRRSPAPAAPFLARPLDAEAAAVIDLAVLHDFLKGPVKFFIRTCLGVNLPESPTRTGGRLVAPTSGASGVSRADDGRNLVLELDSLEAWQVADRLLGHRRAGGDLESFRRRELASNLLPPGRLAEVAISAAADKIEPMIRHLGELGVLDSEPSQRSIDVTLPDGTRVVGAVRDDGGSIPGPVTVTASTWNEARHLGPWLDLLALSANEPAQEWSASLVAHKKVKAGFGYEPIRLPSTTAADRQARALAGLATIVDLYRRGRREPLPIFPKTSARLARDKSANSEWEGFLGSGERFDRWVQLAHGDLSLGELLAVPRRDDDPVGPGDGRVQLYASLLWDAYDGSLTSHDDAQGAVP